MAYVITQEIQGNECIGDSRIKINSNFDKLDTVVVALSTNTISVSATDTILHTYTPTIRRLASNVRDNSIQAKHLQTDSVTTAKLSAQAVTNAKIAFDGGSFNFRNKIINGGFDIWQRGSSFTNTPNTDNYTVDRFRASFTGSGSTGTSTVTQQIFDYNSGQVPNGIVVSNYARYTTSANFSLDTNGSSQFSYRFENIKNYLGKTFTLSFWARASSAGAKIGAHFVGDFGLIGGAGNQSFPTAVMQHQNLPTTWTKFVHTFTIPTVTGKTFGADNGSLLGMGLNFGIGATQATSVGYSSLVIPVQSCNYDITQVQLEEGPAATPFELIPIGLQQELCQRYFEFGGLYIDNNTSPSVVDSNWRLMYHYQTPKRGTPTITTIANPWIAGTTGYANSPTGLITYANTYLSVFSVSIGSGSIEYSFAFQVDAEL